MSAGASQPVGLYYRPLFNVALTLNYQLFGVEVFGWHAVSLLLHLAATFWVYQLAKAWSLESDLALAATLLFGVHPVHCESVAWASALPDLLAAVFLLPAVVLYEQARRRPSPGRLALAVGLALLAMFSKEIAVVLPAFLLCREALGPDRRFRRVLPFLGAAVLYLGARYEVLGFLSKVEPKAIGVAASHVWFTIPSLLTGYARLLVGPYPLAVAYGLNYVTSPADPRFWALALGVVGVVAGGAWLVRSSVAGRQALLLLILFLLPVLNTKAFNQDESLIHDRYLYIPSVGFCILLSLALHRLAGQRWFWTSSGLLAGAFFVLTVRQNRVWSDDLTLMQHALRFAPGRPFLLNYLGAYFAEHGYLPEAERRYRAALESNPDYYDSLTNLADVYRVTGRFPEAETLYRRAIGLGAPYADTYYNLGVTLRSLGKLGEAETVLVQAVGMNPGNAGIWFNLAWIYEQQGRLEPAEKAYYDTLRANPAYVEPRINLAALLVRRERYAEALEQAETAQRYAPSHPAVLYLTGDILLKMRRYADAVQTFEKLASIQPAHPLVHTSLGLCFEGLGDQDRARAHFRSAIEVAPQNPYTNVARERLKISRGSRAPGC
jgi:tetratricopeptide (TPR) repeat protein